MESAKMNVLCALFPQYLDRSCMVKRARWGNTEVLSLCLTSTQLRSGDKLQRELTFLVLICFEKSNHYLNIWSLKLFEFVIYFCGVVTWSLLNSQIKKRFFKRKISRLICTYLIMTLFFLIPVIISPYRPLKMKKMYYLGGLLVIKWYKV